MMWQEWRWQGTHFFHVNKPPLLFKPKSVWMSTFLDFHSTTNFLSKQSNELSSHGPWHPTSALSKWTLPSVSFEPLEAFKIHVPTQKRNTETERNRTYQLLTEVLREPEPKCMEHYFDGFTQRSSKQLEERSMGSVSSYTQKIAKRASQEEKPIAN